MQTINHETLIPISILDHAMRAAFGSNCVGASSGYDSAVHFENPLDSGEETLLENIFSAYDTLTVNTDTSTITADNVDEATITCNDAQISGDADIDCIVIQHNATGDVIDASDTYPVDTGAVELTYATDEPGDYTIFLIRKTGNFAIGFVTITAE